MNNDLIQFISEHKEDMKSHYPAICEDFNRLFSACFDRNPNSKETLLEFMVYLFTLNFDAIQRVYEDIEKRLTKVEDKVGY